MSDKESKTEDPTPKRLKEAREEGRIAKSQDLTAWASILAGVMIMRMTGSRVSNMLTETMNRMSEVMAEPDIATALSFTGSSIAKAFVAILPLVLMFTALAIIFNVAQVRFVIARKAMKPQINRLNPLTGFKRLFSSQSLFQAGKELLKTIVFGYIAYRNLHDTVIMLARGGPYAITEVVRVTVGATLTFVRDVAFAGVVIGLIDYVFQRRKIMQGMKMTKHEVKEEYKQQDGNPEIKGKIRAKQREMSRNRMMAAIRDADVVVVNPVHIAIALKYDPNRGAPRVTAKGAGFVAEKIRDRADEHKVPIVQDIHLARALHKSCDIDDEVPGAFFEAVAQVLAFVFGLRARGTSSGFHKMPGTPDLADVERDETRAAAKQLAGTS